MGSEMCIRDRSSGLKKGEHFTYLASTRLVGEVGSRKRFLPSSKVIPRRPASITNEAVCLPIIQRRKILPEELLITCSNSYSLFIYIIFYYEYFSEHGFLLDLARVQLLPSAAASRKEPRNAVCSANGCLLYTSPSPRDLSTSRMPSSA